MTNSRPDIAFLLATSGHSGVDRIMTNLIAALAERGLRIDVLHITGHGPYIEEPPAGVHIIELGTRHVGSSLPAVVRYLRRARPAALLSDKDRLNRLALWARRLSGVPTRTVVRMGTTVSKNLERRSVRDRWVQRASLRWFYGWADAVVVPSRGAAEDLAKLSGLPASRIHALPSPVISDRMLALADEPITHPWLQGDERPVVLGVGELCARKDFATLIRAFARVRAEYKARLVILGEGRKRAELQDLVSHLSLEADVDLPGFVANPYPYMKSADVFALSSTCEGAPVVLMEALGLGTPVVSTDCPSGPREILADGQYGRLVPVGHPGALGEALVDTLISRPDPQGLRAGAEPYRVEPSAQRYLEVLGLTG